MNKKLTRSLNTLFGVLCFTLTVLLSTPLLHAQPPAGCPRTIDESQQCEAGGTKAYGVQYKSCVTISTGCCGYASINEYCDYTYDGGLTKVRTYSGYKAHYGNSNPGGKCVDGACTPKPRIPSPTPTPEPAAP